MTKEPDRIGAVRSDYTRFAPSYESRWRAFNAVVRNWVLAEWPAGLCGGARVLDVGCGTGGFLGAVGSRWPQLELFGFDMTPALLAEARRAAPRARLVEGDAEAAPFCERSFDVVCSLNVAHHLGDLAAHLAALAGLTKPGGTIFLSTFAGERTWVLRAIDAWLKLRNPAWRGMWSLADVAGAVEGVPGLTVQHRDVRRTGVWHLQLYRFTVEQ